MEVVLAEAGWVFPWLFQASFSMEDSQGLQALRNVAWEPLI